MPLRVHAADGKRVFRGVGPVDRQVDDAAMREIAEQRGCSLKMAWSRLGVSAYFRAALMSSIRYKGA
jgi:hypothetical protein